MHTSDLFQPHVAVVHKGAKHFYSFLMIIPEGCDIMYKDRDTDGEPHDGSTNSFYGLKFSYDSNRSGQWFQIPGLKLESVEINGKKCQIASFMRPIKDSDMNPTDSRAVTRATDHPHKLNNEEIFIHDGTIHLPGGS